jgi:hypothetical protein
MDDLFEHGSSSFPFSFEPVLFGLVLIHQCSFYPRSRRPRSRCSRPATLPTIPSPSTSLLEPPLDDDQLTKMISGYVYLPF